MIDGGHSRDHEGVQKWILQETEALYVVMAMEGDKTKISSSLYKYDGGGGGGSNDHPYIFLGFLMRGSFGASCSVLSIKVFYVACHPMGLLQPRSKLKVAIPRLTVYFQINMLLSPSEKIRLGRSKFLIRKLKWYTL